MWVPEILAVSSRPLRITHSQCQPAGEGMMKVTGVSRRAVFEQLDRPPLKPLPHTCL